MCRFIATNSPHKTHPNISDSVSAENVSCRRMAATFCVSCNLLQRGPINALANDVGMCEGREKRSCPHYQDTVANHGRDSTSRHTFLCLANTEREYSTGVLLSNGIELALNKLSTIQGFSLIHLGNGLRQK